MNFLFFPPFVAGAPLVGLDAVDVWLSLVPVVAFLISDLTLGGVEAGGVLPVTCPLLLLTLGVGI